MKKRNFLAVPIIVFLLFVLFANNFIIETFFHPSYNQISTDEAFDEYLDQLFRQEVSANTVSLHYTLKNPEDYGILNHEPTYGEISRENYREAMAGLENIQAVLGEVKEKKLGSQKQMEFDILQSYIDTNLTKHDFYLYQEMLRPSTGIQAEMPILLAEYPFYERADIENYLELLNRMPDYYRQILNFQNRKARSGLFMSEFAATDVLAQCRDFVEKPEENYLLDTFSYKLDSFEGISQEERENYITQNRTLVLDMVIPAYIGLIQGLEELKTKGMNEQGLFYLEKGKEYYAYLVKSYTGSDWSVKDMQARTEGQRAKDMAEAAKLISENPQLLIQSTSYTFPQADPTLILKELREKMKPDFPTSPDISFSVKYVHPSMENYLAPAFYLTVPIDDISRNTIYINGSSSYQKLKLYTTLAHEGFPGHLYQGIMERSQDFHPLRSLLGTSGYAEGWATYVEMFSYRYADMETSLATLLQKDQAVLLSLYATADMGIHQDGWSLEEMKEFFNAYQIDDDGALNSIYHLIVEEPAHYLKYYIGYLEFLNIKELAQKRFGEDYSDYKFHEALMKMGPANFSVLKKYLGEFYG